MKLKPIQCGPLVQQMIQTEERKSIPIQHIGITEERILKLLQETLKNIFWDEV
ncbi:MAG TPA: hypothetical protein VMY59_00485 [Candidatus Thermoplasmatota archaeon]|nr:hypothetical protein [Candidatus Thermoplasmatota archaeon]